MKNNNVYDEIHRVQRNLEKLNEHEISEEIEDTITAGSTGSEILMGVRWKFGNYIKDRKDLPLEIKKEIQDLLRMIDDLLDA